MMGVSFRALHRVGKRSFADTRRTRRDSSQTASSTASKSYDDEYPLLVWYFAAMLRWKRARVASSRRAAKLPICRQLHIIHVVGSAGGFLGRTARAGLKPQKRAGSSAPARIKTCRFAGQST
jgi:hypothetical protein